MATKKKTTTIKLNQLAQLQKELTSLLSEKISFSTKWDIKTMLDSFKDEFKNLNESISEIYKEYGEDNGDGNLHIKEDNIKDANKELLELTEKEIEIKGKLSFEDLSKIESEFQYYEVFSIVEK